MYIRTCGFLICSCKFLTKVFYYFYREVVTWVKKSHAEGNLVTVGGLNHGCKN